METSREMIGRKVRQLRRRRSWTQQDLAHRLGLSQGRLSRVERGAGSFTAEEFIGILRIFNVDVDEFVDRVDDAHDLQNALVRFGATHLREMSGGSVRTAHRYPRDVVRAVLLQPYSGRLVAALAPVLVVSAESIPLAALQHDLFRSGVPNRLGWLVENTAEVLPRRETTLPSVWRRRLLRSGLLFESFLSHLGTPGDGDSSLPDPFDQGIRSKRTLSKLWREASAISRKWNIASALQPDDFERALRGAIETGS